MSLITGRAAVVKLAVISVFAAVFAGVLLLGVKPEASAASNGPSPSFTDAPGETNCTTCHADYPVNSGSGSVTIMGVPSNYTPGQPYQITVTTSQTDAVIYGFQMTAIDGNGQKAGNFTVPMQQSQTQTLNGFVGEDMLRQYVEHTINGVTPTMFGSKSWTFTWTAPTQPVGTIGFYAAGNAASSDGSSSGDYIYTAAVSSAIPSFTVGGLVTIPGGAPLRNALVTLTDEAGVARTAITSAFGLYSFDNVAAGEDITVRVTSKRYRFSLKALTVNGNLSNVDFAAVN